MTLDITIGGTAADSYGALLAYQAYATAKGWTLTSSDPGGQEAELRRAVDYLDREYIWVGSKTAQENALQWPRDVVSLDPDGFVILSTVIPDPVIDAQFELAFLQDGGQELFPTLSTGAVETKRVKAGPVESETEYSEASEAAGYTSIDGLLRGYVVGGGRLQTNLVRG